MTTTDTNERYAGAATGEEARFFAGLHQLAPLTETIKGIEFRLGEDSDNAPAVWITIRTNADDKPSKRKIAELNNASETLRSAVRQSPYTRWPYVQIKAD